MIMIIMVMSIHLIVDQCVKKALEDAIEHRHGQMRIPLISGIGSSVCVSDIAYDELVEALDFLDRLHEVEPHSTSCSTSSEDDLSEED